MESNTDDGAQVDWNIAKGVEYRINGLLNYCVEFRANADYNNWFFRLCDLDLEINYKLNAAEKDLLRNEFRTASDLVSLWTSYSKGKAIPREINTKAWQALIVLEKHLRDLLGKYGFLMPEKGKPGRAIVGGK